MAPTPESTRNIRPVERPAKPVGVSPGFNEILKMIQGDINGILMDINGY
jgi:hypothetical protein